MQPMWLCICSGWRSEDTYENSLWWKSIQMQPMRLYICSETEFEDSYGNSLWRKSIQMPPMCLCICSEGEFEGTFEETFESSLGNIWDGTNEISLNNHRNVTVWDMILFVCGWQKSFIENWTIESLLLLLNWTVLFVLINGEGVELH